MSIITSIFLGLLLLPASQAQPVTVYIPTDEVVDYARMIARDEGYDVTKTAVYSFELLRAKDGKPPLEGYTSIGFEINGSRRNTIAISNTTGQSIDMFSCEVFDYPDLKRFQKQMIRLTKAKRKTAQELAHDAGCSSPKVTNNPVPLLPAPQSSRVIVPIARIATSDAIDLSRMIARDEGYDVPKDPRCSFELLTEFGGETNTSIGFDVNGHARNLIVINNSTGQAIDYNTCEIFDYPNLGPFQDQMTRLSGVKKKTAQELANDIGCESPRVLTKPVSRTRYE